MIIFRKINSDRNVSPTMSSLNSRAMDKGDNSKSLEIFSYIKTSGKIFNVRKNNNIIVEKIFILRLMRLVNEFSFYKNSDYTSDKPIGKNGTDHTVSEQDYFFPAN